MLNSTFAPHGMVVAPHHLAAEAGLAVLREGGNAVEAMIAAAAAIGDSDVASKSARYILDAFSDHSPLGGEWDGGFGDVPPGLERASSVSLSRSEALIELALRAANEPHEIGRAHV